MMDRNGDTPARIRMSTAFIPSVVLAFSLMSGIIAGEYADGKNGERLAGFIPVMGSLAFANPTPIGLFGAGFVTGAAFGCLKHRIYAKQPDFPDSDLTLKGKVTRASPGLHGYTDLMIRVTETLSDRVEKVNFILGLSIKCKVHPEPGSEVRTRAVLKNTFQSRLFEKGVFGKTAAAGFLLDREPLAPAVKAGRRLKDVLKDRDDDASGLLAALSLGRRWEADQTFYHVMRRTGTCHLMAVSGVHIGSALLIPLFLFNYLLAGFMKDIIGWKGILPLSAGIMTLAVYLSLTGLSSSAVRAGVFALFYRAAVFVRRYPHPFHVLGWCVVLMVCMFPVRQPDMALVMSASAVAGILKACSQPGPLMQKALQTTIGAVLFTLPMSVLLAGGISFAAPVCNILAGLAFGIFLIPLAVLIDLAACVPAFPLKLPVSIWIHLAIPVMSVLRWFSDLPVSFLVLGHSSCIVAAAAALMAIIFWNKKDFQLRTGIVLFLAVAVTAACFGKAEDYLKRDVTILNFPRVGQADAAILTGSGRTVLIDCAAAGRPGRMTELEKRLVMMGISEINALFLTHAHPDHIGGLRDLMNRWKIGVLYLPEMERNSDRWSRALGMTRSETEIVSLKENDKVRIGPFRFQVMGPPSAVREEKGENARSLQLVVKWADMTALFTGDAPWEQVQHSLERMNRLELIKIPHHGSRTGFPPDGLAPILTRLRGHGSMIAVFPCSPPGMTPLPSVDVVQWFEEKGVRCLFTGQGEGLIFVYGEKILISDILKKRILRKVSSVIIDILSAF